MSKIDDYKNKVSIIDYIQYKKLPFTVSDKSSRNQIRIYEENNINGNTVRGDILIISRFMKEGKTYDNYFIAIDSWKNKSHTIIDFVDKYVLKNRTSKINFGKIFTELDKYIASSDYKNPSESMVQLKTHTSSGNSSGEITLETKQNIKAPTSKMFDYLKSRRINTNVYISDVFSSTYAIYTYQEKNQINNNPSFLYLNQKNKIQTLQQIVEYTGKNGFVRQKYFLKEVDKGEALWKSNRLHNINLIIVTEAPEKCMAHYQIYKDEMKKNNVIPYYLATGGNISNEQLEHLFTIVKEYDKQMILSFDNDQPGKYYELKTLLYFNTPRIQLSKTTINDNSFYQITILSEDSLKFTSPKEENYYYTKQHKNTEAIHTDLIKMVDKVPGVKLTNDINNNLVYNIENNKENYTNIFQTLANTLIKNNSIKVAKQHSITKDWVDDLERIDTLKVKTYEKKGLNL